MKKFFEGKIEKNRIFRNGKVQNSDKNNKKTAVTGCNLPAALL